MKFCDCSPCSCPLDCVNRYSITFYPLNATKYKEYTLCFSPVEKNHVIDLYHDLITHENFNGFMYDPAKVEIREPIQLVTDRLEEEDVIHG